MGCTSSKEFQKQAKRDGWEAPMNRSQSMPVTSASKYPARDDSFHVVALTSSTYGILTVDAPDGDRDLSGLKDKTEVDAVSEMYQKMRDFDIPEVMEPKPWAEMSFNLPQLNLQLKPKSPLVVGGLSSEPETINMWELMDGLDDDLSPFPRGAVSASPFRLRQLEKANSMFAVRTVEELDAASATTVDDPMDSNKAPVGAQSGKLAMSTSFSVQGAGKENAKPNSLSALMAQRSVTNSPLVLAKSVPSPVAPGNPSKDALPSLQIPSTLIKPSKSTSTAASVAVGSPVRKSNEMTAPVSVSTPKLSSISGSSSTPVRPASAGRHPGSSSNQIVAFSAEIPPLTLESGFEHISVSKSTVPILDKKASSRGVSPKLAGKIPPLSLDSSYEQISLPQSTAVNGLQVYAGVKVSPKLAERLAAFSASSPRREYGSSPRASANAKAEDGKSSVKQVVPLSVATSQRQSLSDDPEVTYVNNYPSSPDESEDPNSPLFDPDLLASFEKAFEQISEDDWYAVRTGGETTSSGSTTDVESPVQRGGRDGALYLEKSSGTEVNAKGNKISQVIPESVQQVPSKVSGEVKNLKVSSSKVSPLVIDEKVIQVKEDPLDKFERKCPPGGEEVVVLYVTSCRVVRPTFDHCNNLRMILQSFSVFIDERDVARDSGLRQELKDLMGKPVPVPRVFIKGRYVGGQKEVAQLHEDGLLALLVDGLPEPRAPCDCCGDVRFVPCMKCSGSCKVRTEEDEKMMCPDCNENGLMRCPICFQSPLSRVQC